MLSLNVGLQRETFFVTLPSSLPRQLPLDSDENCLVRIPKHMGRTVQCPWQHTLKTNLGCAFGRMLGFYKCAPQTASIISVNEAWGERNLLLYASRDCVPITTCR